MNEITGWTIVKLSDGSVSILHSSGFYVAGFDSKVEAGVWLTNYLLGQFRETLRLQAQVERSRLRVLARMGAHGRVS